MKNLTRFQKILVVLLVICLPIGVIGMLMTMPTGREATVEELTRYGGYDVMTDSLPGDENQTITERLLAQCTKQGTESAGDNEYDSYHSETLGQYLVGCATLDKVLADENAVYIYFTDSAGISVFLTFDAEGLKEQSVYDPQRDIMFYQSREVSVVYENFSKYTEK